jgi:hypothetical protein
VDEDGKKINDKFEHRRSMDACRELEQQQYGLIPADRKQKSQSSFQPLKPVDYTKGDVKRQIANVIRPVVHDYHFPSLNEYSALLLYVNVYAKEVK